MHVHVIYVPTEFCPALEPESLVLHYLTLLYIVFYHWQNFLKHKIFLRAITHLCYLKIFKKLYLKSFYKFYKEMLALKKQSNALKTRYA